MHRKYLIYSLISVIIIQHFNMGQAIPIRDGTIINGCEVGEYAQFEKVMRALDTELPQLLKYFSNKLRKTMVNILWHMDHSPNFGRSTEDRRSLQNALDSLEKYKEPPKFWNISKTLTLVISSLQSINRLTPSVRLGSSREAIIMQKILNKCRVHDLIPKFNRRLKLYSDHLYNTTLDYFHGDDCKHIESVKNLLMWRTEIYNENAIIDKLIITSNYFETLFTY
ncbi:uncharacterized protein LOC119689422 [Teleopsis dalmanni]|uniref:uncharacterized protein LOC119689422 n=1 Tax=Teleopsis dalmanni TaxID=139649 RepID=UPI0018CDB5C4|nr:uncharacterized protein LOC119689422 [Teleopsis dalmanni]